MQILVRRTLPGLTGGNGRPHTTSDLGFARIEHDYPVQEPIPEVGVLVHDRSRPDRLSEIAGVELEPLYAEGSQSGGSTTAFRGPVDVGLARLQSGGRISDDELLRITSASGPAF